MARTYGKPACEVEQPDAELVPYLIEGVTPTDPAVLRAWTLTSPKGEVHAVSEYAGGRYGCTCPAFTRFTRHGLRFTVGSKMVCKHVYSIHQRLTEAKT